MQASLSTAQRLEFLRKLDEDASELMKIVLKDPRCFTPNVGSPTFGHFWGIFETRRYINLLMTISTLAEELEDYQMAYDYNLRILTYNQGDNTGTRYNFNLLQTKLNKDLEAYNLSMHLLDQHLEYDRVMEPLKGKDYPKMILDRIKKEDIDPQSSQVHPSSNELRFADASILFTGALAIFKLFGSCPKATTWLAKGHARNSHILSILMHPDSPSYPTKRFDCPRGMGSYIEAADFVIFTKRQFCTNEAQEWLRIAGADLPRRKCDCPGCGKEESYMGEWRRCTGCFEVYYCSVECQKNHWGLQGRDGHKASCKNAKRMMDGF